VDTYVNVLLEQGKSQQAMPYLKRMKNTEGWPNVEYTKYIEKYHIKEE